MSAKKSGWLFLGIIVIYIGTSMAFAYTQLAYYLKLNFVGSAFLSSALIWVPALLFLLINRTNPVSFCRFRKMHVSTAFMTVLFAFMAMPAATLMNILSMFFVDNAVEQMNGDLLSLGFFLSLFLIAVYAPFAEELAFRGALMQGFRQSGSAFKSILLSAFLFGLMHLNFNQMPYAFVLGIIMGLLVEATGSIWSSIIFHFTVNARSVIVLFLQEKLTTWLENVADSIGLEIALDNAEAAVTASDLGMMLCLEILVAVVCLPIAACILVWLAKREGNTEKLRAVWSDRRLGRVWSIPVIIAIIIGIVFMVCDVLQLL